MQNRKQVLIELLDPSLFCLVCCIACTFEVCPQSCWGTMARWCIENVSQEVGMPVAQQK